MNLTPEEKGFLESALTQIVPAVQVPARDAPAILAMCDSILAKLKEEPQP